MRSSQERDKGIYHREFLGWLLVHQTSKVICPNCSQVIHRPDMLRALISKVPTAIVPFQWPETRLSEPVPNSQVYLACWTMWWWSSYSPLYHPPIPCHLRSADVAQLTPQNILLLKLWCRSWSAYKQYIVTHPLWPYYCPMSSIWLIFLPCLMSCGESCISQDSLMALPTD